MEASSKPEVHHPEPEPIPVRTAPPAPPARSEADYLISTFRAAGMILSARGLLAMSLTGAFALAAEAMWKGDVMSLIALGLYGVSTVAPLVWLESRRGR